MKIDYEYSGGYFYMELGFHQDTQELLPEIAQEICQLVENARVFEIDPLKIIPAPKGLPDITLYQLSLSDGPKKISLQCNDITAPQSLRPLLARLRVLALKSSRLH